MIQDIKINSNINLHYIPQTKLKTTTVGVYIRRPLNADDASYNALLPYVLKSGCMLCCDTEQIAKYLENLYGASLFATVMKHGETQLMYFDAEAISDKYCPHGETLMGNLIELLLSVLFEPIVENGGFKADVVSREKKNALDRIEAAKNDKRTYAAERCKEEMCRGEAFAVSRLGTREGIEEIDEKSLYKYYTEMIKSSAIDIYICGDADMESVADKIREKTNGIDFNCPKTISTEILNNTDEVKNIVDRMDVVQGKLSVGFTTNTKVNDSDFAALMVMNSVFGAGAHSKLFNNVREKLSLAYYASSQLERYKGLLVVNSGIEFSNFQKAYDEILVQLDAVKNGEISDLEFDSSINAILNSLEALKDDQRAMQSYYLGEMLSGTNTDIEQKKKMIKAVTKEDISRVAKKLCLNTVYFLSGKEEK